MLGRRYAAPVTWLRRLSINGGYDALYSRRHVMTRLLVRFRYTYRLMGYFISNHKRCLSPEPVCARKSDAGVTDADELTECMKERAEWRAIKSRSLSNRTEP